MKAIPEVSGSFTRSRLAFDFISTSLTFSDPRLNIQVGIVYKDADLYSAVAITLDGFNAFGALLTPPSVVAPVDTWMVAASILKTPALTQGQHRLEISVTRGSLSIASIILTNENVTSPHMMVDKPNPTFVVNAQNYITVSSPPGFIRNVFADILFKDSSKVNFCFNKVTPNIRYW
jgi:hypothetical protein